MSKATLRSPSSLAIAAGDPGWWSGRTKLESSSRVPQSGGRSMTISVRESGIPMTVSRNSLSTGEPHEHQTPESGPVGHASGMGQGVHASPRVHGRGRADRSPIVVLRTYLASVNERQSMGFLD